MTRVLPAPAPFRPTSRRLAACVVLLAALLAAPAASAAGPPKPAKAASGAREPGETWSITAEMSMKGMESFRMPAQTQQVCLPKAEPFAEPPRTEQEKDHCTLSDVVHRGNSMSWKITCTQPKAHGSGTMTWSGRDSYEGTMTMVTEEGEMLMKTRGKRLGAECDAGALRRQVEAQVAEGQAAQAAFLAQTCSESAKSGNLSIFLGPNAMCTSPADKAALCAGLGTVAGYEGAVAMSTGGRAGIPEGAAYCGTDPAALKKSACADAIAKDGFEFLGKHCPEAKAELVQKECAGRKPTSLMGTRYYGFCLEHGRETMAGASAPGAAPGSPAAPPAKEKAIDKGKKLLKGILGR